MDGVAVSQGDWPLNVTRCTTEYRKVSRDANEEILLASSAARWIEALQRRDPCGDCHRNRREKQALHCPAHPDGHPGLVATVQGDIVLLHGAAGCLQDAVIGALRERGLWGQEGTATRIPSGIRWYNASPSL
jgi:hypothetical protein